MKPIRFSPLRDLIWTRPVRPSRLRFEEAEIGDTIFAHGSEAGVREMLFRSHVSRGLDWTWDLRLEDPQARRWACKRVG